MVSRLQTKASQIGQILQTLEKKYDSKIDQHDLIKEVLVKEKSNSSNHRRIQTNSHHQKLDKKPKGDGPPLKKLHLKVDPIPPFNANKVRKSPSISATTNDGNASSSSSSQDATKQNNKKPDADNTPGVPSSGDKNN